MPSQYRAPEQLTVYIVITRTSLSCLMIYIFKQRTQHLLVWNNAPPHIRKPPHIRRLSHKYLSIEENFDIQHKNEKEKLKKEYLRRLRLVLGTELSAKNKIQATGSLAVPVLRYSFVIFNWQQEELQKLDQKTRKLLTIHGQHHPKADVDRLYVPRKQGGRGWCS